MSLRKKKGKVFVGMSGGVDSSVTAALLKKRGFDVTGVFIKVWEPKISHKGTHVDVVGETCTWKEDRLDAMRVAAHLDIPFMTLDLEKEYKKEIVDYMVREYKTGRTPNPDVMCNKHIKFGAFFDKAMALGADYVATGHYARVLAGKGLILRRSLRRERSNLEEQAHKPFKYKLFTGLDKNKDQSYFLWTLKQKQLHKTLFPVGEYEKSEVRKIAEKFGLSTAKKKDSQGLCFIGKLDMKEFLKDFIPEKKGDVLNIDGEIVGVHDGVYFYTLGQRHGFTITKKGTNDLPYFIVKKDVNTNTIIVSNKVPNTESSSGKKEIVLSEINWISGEQPQQNKKYSARVRYRQKLVTCTLSFSDSNIVRVLFDTPQIADAGQSIVVYNKDECLGGGVIA